MAMVRMNESAMRDFALFGIAFVYAPNEAGCQQDDIYDDTTVEGQSECVDEEQLEPAAYFYNARNDAVQYGCHQHH